MRRIWWPTFIIESLAGESLTAVTNTGPGSLSSLGALNPKPSPFSPRTSATTNGCFNDTVGSALALAAGVGGGWMRVMAGGDDTGSAGASTVECESSLSASE